jgi:hypothetical protein
METIYNRYHRAQQSSVLANVPFAKFQERQQTSRRYRVFTSKVGVYQVQIPDSGQKYIVELAENSCSCRNFWEYHGPCAHAIAACRFAAEDPYEHFSNAYTLKLYRRTYEVAMPPLSIENLPSDPKILPPLIAKKRGRPRVKRIRKGALKRKQRKCTNCLQLGHNKRRCVAQPAPNGRAERARNWNQDISSSESNSELERELAPFVEQARAKAKAKAKAIVAARVAARAAARATARAGAGAGNNESELSDLQSSDVELTAPLSLVPASPASPASPALPASPVSPALQLRPKRARKVPARYQG